MAASTVTANGRSDVISDAEAPLLNDVVRAPSTSAAGPPSDQNPAAGSVEMAERFAYYGISANLVSYLTGPLGQSTARAAANVNAWSGTAFLSPLLGAFIADSYLGKYRTIVFASLLYILNGTEMEPDLTNESEGISAISHDTYIGPSAEMMITMQFQGLGFLSLSAALQHSDKTHSPPQLQIIFFFSSLYLVALAQGGHKPCLQAFGAEQFDDSDQDECKAKSSFFNWWNFCLCASVLVGLLVLSYIQDNMSWELGFGIPCIVMCLALIVFVLGSFTYRFQLFSGQRNPFFRIGRVFFELARNWRVRNNNAVLSVEVDSRYEKNPEFLKIRKRTLRLINSDTKSLLRFVGKGLLEPNNSKDIEDAKTILRLLPICLTCLVYSTVYSQSTTFFTKQGATMDRHITASFQLPAASLQSFTAASLVLFIPIYERVLVPVARALTRKPTGISLLQRVGTGVFLSVISMTVAGFVENKRLKVALEHGLVDSPGETIPMSVLWLGPQYLVLGIADVFTLVGLQEFVYDQIPGDLKSMGLAISLGVLGTGSFLSGFIVSVIDWVTGSGGGAHQSWFSSNLNRAHLDYFYWLLAGLSACSCVLFVYLARSYVYSQINEAKEDAEIFPRPICKQKS
ncbi:major facilitator superfamily protein [Striga asiatica]|uniref:Major facilitator superfamily protein n=1 Tax=Striga asiatica TaxID=4170 RepID=A0A5A7QUZ7_STRAF|nr:major facilitator superfamily protein [Striga asiatica]